MTTQSHENVFTTNEFERFVAISERTEPIGDTARRPTDLDIQPAAVHDGEMVGIHDVARKAGVSIATVSRALSNPDVVSDGTRGRVVAAIDALGYVPNVQARALRTARTQRLLVTVPDISNPFFGGVLRSAEEAARAAGYAIIVGDTRGDPEIEDEYATMLARGEVDGLIFLGDRFPEPLHPLLKAGGTHAPIVNGCEYSAALPVSSVHIDNLTASAQGLAHLAGLGHRRIGVITGPAASQITVDRTKGVRAGAATHGVTEGLEFVEGDYSVESGYELGSRLLDGKRVTALFAFGDEMAIGALDAVARKGLSCPDDVSVLGFDDIRFARFMRPSLSTISQPADAIGRGTVETLLAILGGRQDGLADVTLPVTLRIRESTGRAPTDAVDPARSASGRARARARRRRAADPSPGQGEPSERRT